MQNTTNQLCVFLGATSSLVATSIEHPVFELAHVFFVGLIGGFGGYVGKIIIHKIWIKIQKK